MRLSDRDLSDSTMVRSRGKGCIVSTVAAPFVAGYWPDVNDLVAELGLPQVAAGALENPNFQKRFLSALADKAPEAAVFRPQKTGFKWRAEDILFREGLRATRCVVTFLGNCSKEVLIGALGALIERGAGRLGAIDVQFKLWDVLSDWPAGSERLDDVLNCLQLKKVQCGSFTFFSAFKEVPDELWEYLYDSPQMRVCWQADDLAGFDDLAQFDRYRRESRSFINLETLSNKGIFPYIVLPATKVNIKILPELAQTLAATVGGGTIEIIPVPLVPGIAGDPPSMENYTTALMAIYKDSRIPLRMVAPQSWVADRVDSINPLISSPEAAGASLAVLANGDIYAAEAAVGLDQWHLGNILEAGKALRWERLDAMPEVFSTSTKPDECKICDWRYRCGGVDPSVLLLKESDVSADWQTLFQLYCAPRKALFEEIFMDSVTHLAVANNTTTQEVKN